MTPRGLFIGLMSGTSMDGIDAVLVELTEGQTLLKETHSQSYDPALREQLAALAAGTHDNVDKLAMLDRAVGIEFARASNALLSKGKYQPADITAVGSHGQTVRHQPQGPKESRYSLQIGDPASIAELTGITTVADFRRRDIAAGGQGAPLVPLFHAAQFGYEGQCRAIVNVGGISNATLLDGASVLGGFDCGPGNTLLDAWIRRHRGDAFDADGAWSAEHQADPDLLFRLTQDPYFTRTGPRSTGPELFNLEWLDAQLSSDLNPGVVQATLAELTAFAIADSIGRCKKQPVALFVCGGGARNTDLMRRLHSRLSAMDVRLGTSDELGLASEWVEACAFAWLASRTISGQSGNAELVTGAAGPRILGAIYPT